MNENSLLRNTISLRKHYLYTETGAIMETKLRRISEISQENPKEVFTSIGHLMDADIEEFFNHIDHEWMIKFVEVRVKDPNIIRLIRRQLKAGITENGEYKKTEEGSEQGSGCSPILANIYMHYVLVLWFYKVVKPQFKGYCEIVVYADDFVTI